MKMNFKAVKVSPMEKVFSTAAPSEEGAREKLSGLKGEVVSFQIAYYAESQGFARAEAENFSSLIALSSSSSEAFSPASSMIHAFVSSLPS